MKILAGHSLASKHFSIGYALYIARQPISACQNADQRRGWHNAYIGEMAAVTAELESVNVANVGNRGW